jgi:hypothetical protein
MDLESYKARSPGVSPPPSAFTKCSALLMSESVAMPSLLEQIKEALANATPGPWRWQPAGVREGDGYRDHIIVKEVLRSFGQDMRHGPGCRVLRTGEDIGYDDAELIAHAPSWLKCLVDEVERLRRLVGEDG